MLDLPSTKPYLLRALWEWCCDCGFTPHIAVMVDDRTKVPREFVRDGQIVLNISPDATNRLQIGNEWLEFQARFGGIARDLSVPIGQIAAIYARENGSGMAFDVTVESNPENSGETLSRDVDHPDDEPPGAPRPEGGRPKLQRIK